MPRNIQRKPVATILTCVLSFLCANTILAADDKPYSVVDGKLDENTFTQ